MEEIAEPFLNQRCCLVNIMPFKKILPDSRMTKFSCSEVNWMLRLTIWTVIFFQNVRVRGILVLESHFQNVKIRRLQTRIINLVSDYYGVVAHYDDF